MLDELTAIVDGYNSYFSFSKVKSGYSGQTFCNSVYVTIFVVDMNKKDSYCQRNVRQFLHIWPPQGMPRGQSR